MASPMANSFSNLVSYPVTTVPEVVILPVPWRIVGEVELCGWAVLWEDDAVTDVVATDGSVMEEDPSCLECLDFDFFFFLVGFSPLNKSFPFPMMLGWSGVCME